jgi:hypothetical protein
MRTVPGRRRALVLPKPKQSTHVPLLVADSSCHSGQSGAEAPAAVVAGASITPAVTESVRIRLLVCGTRFVVAAVHGRGCISWGGCWSYETAQRPCRHALCAHCSSSSSSSSGDTEAPAAGAITLAAHASIGSSGSSSSSSSSSAANQEGKCAPNWVQGLQDANIRCIAAGKRFILLAGSLLANECHAYSA